MTKPDRVSAWLEPMFCAAEQRPGIDLWAVMHKATVPVLPTVPEGPGIEPGWPDAPELATVVVDWVLFGRLLRDALGWDGYPAAPPSDESATS